MRIWLISFGLLFGAVELYQWFQALSVPLPVYVAGGIALAIASNYEKLVEQPATIDAEIAQNVAVVNNSNTLEAEARTSAQLPPSPISFKIDKPAWKNENSRSQ